ncbi:hypothetical protein SS1G_08811 [Sclerotinia sclerotiorum 1980 UF-70]|uniref:Uncharacterized protein n=1 Tax=Sclerotinia sclerotiorum (strain ATCC 18683 / 1980 / Ss-1) TaxID=665079 RepID=A7EU04_SCLS1|nr:hypothetical protein SS1G_08811 [Sclerotinia sclerotiorum 1980 UF-70]EDN92946.1 hypothetical protein SS1G_08811 [Sclerotinia sclerotiorum 1980 UF-70]
MVCAKCQKKSSGTTSLATPEVKKKNDMYFGSPAGSSSSKAGTKTSATLGNNGIGKSKLLSKAARNPYATYSTTCTACAMCGKSNSKTSSTAPVVAGQKFNLK